MKLIELLEITSESTNVFVRDTNGNDLAMYDGKNSIDEIFNNCKIIDMQISDNWLVVIIENNVKVVYDAENDKYYTLENIDNCSSQYVEIVDLVDVLEDAQNGIPSARQFLFDL